MIVAIHCNQDGVRVSRFSLGGETVLHDPNPELRLLAAQVWQRAGGDISGHIAIEDRLNELIQRVAKLEASLGRSADTPVTPSVGSTSHTSRPVEGIAVLPFTAPIKRREYHE